MSAASILTAYGVPVPPHGLAAAWWDAFVFQKEATPMSPLLLHLLGQFLAGGVDHEGLWLNYNHDAYCFARHKRERFPLHSLMCRFLKTFADEVLPKRLGIAGTFATDSDGIARVRWSDPDLRAELGGDDAAEDGWLPADGAWSNPTEYTGPEDHLGAAYHFEIHGFFPLGYGN